MLGMQTYLHCKNTTANILLVLHKPFSKYIDRLSLQQSHLWKILHRTCQPKLYHHITLHYDIQWAGSQLQSHIAVQRVAAIAFALPYCYCLSNRCACQWAFPRLGKESETNPTTRGRAHHYSTLCQSMCPSCSNPQVRLTQKNTQIVIIATRNGNLFSVNWLMQLLDCIPG